MTQAPPAPAEEKHDTPEKSEAVPAIHRWTFEGEGNEPTSQQVLDLLWTLPPVYGVRTVQYADFVQPLPAKKEVDRGPDPRDRNGKARLTEWIPTWTLYFSVPGRIRMLNDIAELNGWTIVEEYDQRTASGVDGILFGEKPVTRIYVEMFDEAGKSLGRRAGTGSASGSGAGKSRPYEKAETAARGRAIAAWGIGVLPGSGVASLEEMQDLREPAEGPGPGYVQPVEERMGRDDKINRIIELLQEGARLRNENQDETETRIEKYVKNHLYVPDAWDEENRRIIWDALNPGKIQVMLDALEQSTRRLRAEGSPV